MIFKNEFLEEEKVRKRLVSVLEYERERHAIKKSKRETIKRRAGEEYCSICYINLLIPGFCINITHRNISSVIEILEQLANYGVLK